MPRFERYLYERTPPGLVPLSHVARTEEVSFYRAQRDHTRGALGEIDDRPPKGLRAVSVDEASFKKRQDYNTTICAPELGRVIELSGGVTEWASPAGRGCCRSPCAAGSRCSAPTCGTPITTSPPPRSPTPCASPTGSTSSATPTGPSTPSARDLQRGPDRGWRKDLFGARWALLRAQEELTERDHDRLAALFARYPDLDVAWSLKEGLRDLYRDSDANSAGPALIAWCRRAEGSGVPSFVKLAGTVRRWKPEILGYFHDRMTNAFAEGVTQQDQVHQADRVRLPELRTVPGASPGGVTMMGRPPRFSRRAH